MAFASDSQSFLHFQNFQRNQQKRLSLFVLCHSSGGGNQKKITTFSFLSYGHRKNVSKKIPCQAGALEALAGAMLSHPMDVELLKVACGALGTICAGKDAAGRHRADLAAEVVFGGWESLKGLEGF